MKETKFRPKICNVRRLLLYLHHFIKATSIETSRGKNDDHLNLIRSFRAPRTINQCFAMFTSMCYGDGILPRDTIKNNIDSHHRIIKKIENESSNYEDNASSSEDSTNKKKK